MARHRMFDAKRNTGRTGCGWFRTIGWMTNGQPYIIYNGRVVIRLGEGLPYYLSGLRIQPLVIGLDTLCYDSRE